MSTAEKPTLHKRILSARETPVVVALILLVITTWAINPRFLDGQGVKDLLLNATIMMILAAGQSLVLLTRGVDISVGSILGLTAFLTGTLFAAVPNIPIILVFLAGTLMGAMLGAFNGGLIALAKVPAMVITLGTLYVFRGLNNAWAGSRQFFAGDRPQAFGDLSVNTLLGIPIITLMAIAVVAMVTVYQRFLRSARDLYALGSEPAAADMFGIPVGRRMFGAFVMNGALVGFAGVLYASRFNSVGATTGTGMEMSAIASAVVGGVAIVGGAGTAAGAAVGALLLTTITGALTAIGIDKFWQQALVGVLILASIVISRVAAIHKTQQLRKELEQ